MKAYHFNNGKLSYGDNREIVVGETLTVDCELELCEAGLHGSLHPFDALRYAQCGHINLDLVEITDGVIEEDDKIVGKSRRVIKRLTGEVLHKLLAQFAQECADRAQGYAAKAADRAAKAAARAADRAAKAAARAAWAADWAAKAARAARAARAAARDAWDAWDDELKWQLDRFLELVEKEMKE